MVGKGLGMGQRGGFWDSIFISAWTSSVLSMGEDLCVSSSLVHVGRLNSGIPSRSGSGIWGKSWFHIASCLLFSWVVSLFLGFSWNPNDCAREIGER